MAGSVGSPFCGVALGTLEGELAMVRGKGLFRNMEPLAVAGRAGGNDEGGEVGEGEMRKLNGVMGEMGATVGGNARLFGHRRDMLAIDGAVAERGTFLR